jgi:spermidine synthase
VTSAPQTAQPAPALSRRQISLLLVSVWVISICGLVYELIIGTLSSYLLGSSVTHFSITIGAFLFAMGIGSYLSRFVQKDVLRVFLLVEILTGVCGGTAAALLMGVFAFTNYFYLAMFAAILLIGGCMGLEIPLLTRLVSERGPLKDHLANIFSVDYLGALIGSLLFPLVLLPVLGLMATAFATGLLNLAVAAAVIAVFRDRLPSWRSAAMLTGVAATLLFVGLLRASSLSSFFERNLYADRIIYTEQTPYQKIVMTRHKNDLRLFLDGSLQFSLLDEYRYHEALVHPAMTLAAAPRRVLILGGGDGLAVRQVLKHPGVQFITLVDIDPAMTRLGQNHHLLREANDDALSDPRVTIVNTDAFNHVANGRDVYDVILGDLPDPRNEALCKLYSQAFYRILQRRLAPGGVIAVQATSPFFARRAYWSIVETMRSAGWATTPFHVQVPSFGDWGFVLAAREPLQPSDYAPAVPVDFLDTAAFQAGLNFPADIARLKVDSSTIDRPAVLSYYESSWRNWR